MRTAGGNQMECIVLIRRFIRKDREQEFLAWAKAQPPLDKPGFQGKTLTRLEEIADLPAGLNSFHLAGNPGCVTYIMVERWKSVEDFRAYVPQASTSDQDRFESAPRQRVILGVV
jgi:heme-degrading monooxygenase HmoA